MKSSNAKDLVQRLLSPSDVRIDGDRPWDLRIHHPRWYERVVSGGSLALGESYMDGWWDCEALDRFFERIMHDRLDRRVKHHALRSLPTVLMAMIVNTQAGSRAFAIGRRHYDLGNRLFTAMLDPWLNYSCGYWEEAQTLNEAQEAKLDLICRKIGLQPGMKVLDVGCGWGGFAKFAAARYGATVRGITVSREQAAFAEDFCSGLDVRIALQDYRYLRETYDRIVSIGMFEHVGFRNYRKFMRMMHRCLAKDGLFLLHTIGGNTSVRSTDPWIRTYIFPNSMLPSAEQIATASQGLFVIEDWHSFGSHYDPTLMAWHCNVTQRWDELQDQYDDRFYRMWTYYLLSCAGSFRARRNQLWQIVFSKYGIPGGYACRER